MCYAIAGREGLTGTGDEMPTKKKRHLAIGGKIIGAEPPPETPSSAETPEAVDVSKPETPTHTPKRRRIAIGGRLY